MVLVIILDKMSYRMHHEVARRAFFYEYPTPQVSAKCEKVFFHDCEQHTDPKSIQLMYVWGIIIADILSHYVHS